LGPPPIKTGTSAPAALAVNAGLGRSFASGNDLVLACACFAGLIGLTNYGSRCSMAIANDALLPPKIAEVHRRFHSPHRAIIMIGLASAAMLVILTCITRSLVTAYTLFAAMITLIWIAPYFLICVGALVLNHRSGKLKLSVVIASTIGVARITWVYITAWVYAPEAPAIVVIWLAPTTLAVTTVGLVAIPRLLRGPT